MERERERERERNTSTCLTIRMIHVLVCAYMNVCAHKHWRNTSSNFLVTSLLIYTHTHTHAHEQREREREREREGERERKREKEREREEQSSCLTIRIHAGMWRKRCFLFPSQGSAYNYIV